MNCWDWVDINCKKNQIFWNYSGLHLVMHYLTSPQLNEARKLKNWFYHSYGQQLPIVTFSVSYALLQIRSWLSELGQNDGHLINDSIVWLNFRISNTRNQWMNSNYHYNKMLRSIRQTMGSIQLNLWQPYQTQFNFLLYLAGIQP